MSALTKEQIDALPGLVVDVPKQWLFAETVSDDGQEWFGCGVIIDGYEAVWLDNEAEKDTPTCRLIALAPSLAATATDQQAEIGRLTAIIAVMDASSPRADHTCAEPGITLSQAVEREYPHLARPVREGAP